MLRDVVLVEELDDKLGFMELVMSQAYTAKCNYEDTFGTVKYWETIIYNFLKDLTFNPLSEIEIWQRQDGAYHGCLCQRTQVGGHNWVMSFDLNSLYPHIIMQYNISPEKLVRGHREDVNVERLLNKECDLSYCKQTNTTVAPTVFYSHVISKVCF